MRNLVLLRGSAGVGKSTFVRENNIEQYTLCADEIRLLFQSPVLDVSGKEIISQANDNKVWDLLYKLLEERMKRGEFTVIDATHSTTKSIKKYKELCEKYRYRAFVVDFTDVPIEEVKRRNASRQEYKRVPESAIDLMYSRFGTQELNKWATVIKPNEFKDVFQFKPLDFSNWKKVHVIGDIHGCFCALMKYLVDGLPNDEMFIFCGDFCDRGIQNSEVLNFLISIMDLPNVIFLEGNHEIHLWKWANDEIGCSEEFEKRTKPQLDKSVSKKNVRSLYRRLRQCAYFTYNGKKILVTHGGLSILPRNLTYVATEQLIKGVGKYETEIDNIFLQNTLSDMYQVHGHRNIQEYPIQVNDRCFNLEGKIEFGGELRIVVFEGESVQTIAIENPYYNEDRFKKKMNVTPIIVDNKSFLEDLRGCNLVNEKQLNDNISSFNFKNAVFFDKLWDKQPSTMKARGLFINTNTTEIVARSYNKFFNINEMEETKIVNLSNTLKFPVKAYVKENGYLGILGYNSETDSLVIASKSTTQGDFKEWFEKLFYKTIDYSDKKEREIKDFLKENNCTMVFEVEDIDNDPHIIKYSESKIVLLDLVYRDINYKKMEYSDVVAVGLRFGFQVKELYTRLENWQQFLNFYNKVTMEDFNPKYPIEGFVFEDVNGYMVKVKLPYYNFWKFMRSLKDKVSKNTNINQSALTTSLANEVYGWLKEQPKEVLEKDIITLREEFYNQKKGV
jgi:predicted kinase/predicted phosphodiesterase